MSRQSAFKNLLVAIDSLRAKRPPPKLLGSQEEVDRINRYEKAIGAPADWRLGDHCYVLKWSE